eukprot:s1128_g2.t1
MDVPNADLQGGEDGPAAGATPVGAAPKKKRRSSGSMGASHAPEIHKCETIASAVKLEGRVKVAFEGCLVEYGAPREVQRGSKGKGKNEVRRVMVLTLMDGGMCASVALWSPVAERFADMIRKGFESVEDQEVYLRVEFNELERKEISKSPLVVKFQSTSKTTVRCSGTSALRVVPESSLVVSAFRGMGEAGVHMHALGIVTELEPLMHSKEGKAMRSGVLTGSDHIGIRFMLFESWAQDGDIQVGSRAMFWYLQSQSPFQGEGYYWLYEEGFLMILEVVDPVPQTTSISEITAEEEQEEP